MNAPKLKPQRSGRSSKGGSTRAQGPFQKLPLVIALVLLAGLFIWSFKRPKTAPAPVLNAKPSEEPKIIANQKQLNKMQKEGQQRTMQLVAERAAGLEPLPLQREGGRPPVLKVAVRSFARGCALGDLDIIRQDMEWRKDPRSKLVLSLEPLEANSSIKPVQKEVSLDALRQGYSTQFALKQVEVRTLMGIFLCSAQRGQACAQQQRPSMTQLGTLQKDIRFGQNMSVSYPQDDKVFFFHFLVAFPDRLLLHDPKQSLESSRNRLEAALDQGGDPVSPILLADVMNRLRAADSLPAIVQKDSIQIQLPHKEARCP